MLQPKPSFVEQISANGNQGISSLSHSMGSPQTQGTAQRIFFLEVRNSASSAQKLRILPQRQGKGQRFTGISYVIASG